MQKMIKILVTCALLVPGTLMSQGKFSGYMFGDFYYNIARDGTFGALVNTASSGAASGTTAMQAFQFRRIYFTYDNDISEKFTSRFRLEVDQAALTSNGKIGAFVKDAYLRWKTVFGTNDLLFGIQPTPAFEISEAAWGYRSLEKTIMDLRGIVASRDFGVSLKGKITENGMFNYWAMFANGAGTSSVEGDKYKRYYAHVQYKATPNIQATINVDYADRVDVADPYRPGTRVGNGMTTISGFAGYSEGAISVNVEGYMQSTSNGYNDGTALATKTGFGFSLFGTYTLQLDIALVGRYDYFDPNIDTKVAAYGDIRHYIILGFSWKPDKNVSIMPNLLYEAYENAAVSNAPVDASLTARVTLFYVFL